MGVQDQYLRHVPASSNHLFGVISSTRCHPLWIANGKLVLVSHCENVVIWNISTSKILTVFVSDKKSAVSSLTVQDNFLAVGYVSGEIRIFSLESIFKEDIIYADTVFNGHKNSVTCLDLFSGSDSELLLSSGSTDSTVIIWDVLSEKGIVKLTGHKSHINVVKFCKENNWLITASTDSSVKFWDTQTKSCFHTLLSHHTEVRKLQIIEETTGNLLFCTGGNTAELKFYTFNGEDSLELGCLERSLGDKVHSLEYTAGILACVGSGKNCDIWRILTKDEREKRLKKRQNKAKKRGNQVPEKLKFEDKFETIQTVHSNGFIRGMNLLVTFEGDKVSKIRFMFMMKSNYLEFWIGPASCNAEFEKVSKLSIPGHRQEPRFLCLGNDNTVLATASRTEVKVWNVESGTSLRTIDVSSSIEGKDKITAILWVPGERHLLVGFNSGKLAIFHLASGSCVYQSDVHSNSIWSLLGHSGLTASTKLKQAYTTSVKSFIAASTDCNLSFHDFDVNDEGHLVFNHQKSLEMDDECLALDKSGKHIAVSLADNCVKLLYADSLKLFVTLYGHTQPVTCVKFSSDGTLVATGGGDRDIRLWSTDFGDCQKKLFAHHDTITGEVWKIKQLDF